MRLKMNVFTYALDTNVKFADNYIIHDNHTILASFCFKHYTAFLYI
jgi:hypothetical protein